MDIHPQSRLGRAQTELDVQTERHAVARARLDDLAKGRAQLLTMQMPLDVNAAMQIRLRMDTMADLVAAARAELNNSLVDLERAQLVYQTASGQANYLANEIADKQRHNQTGMYTETIGSLQKSLADWISPLPG